MVMIGGSMKKWRAGGGLTGAAGGLRYSATSNINAGGMVGKHNQPVVGWL